MDSIEILIPVSVLVSRLEKHLAEMRAELARCPRWKIKRRMMLAASCATYEYELNTVLEWAGAQQPIMQSLTKK